jgi:hypothetical protein
MTQATPPALGILHFNVYAFNLSFMDYFLTVLCSVSWMQHLLSDETIDLIFFFKLFWLLIFRRTFKSYFRFTAKLTRECEFLYTLCFPPQHPWPSAPAPKGSSVRISVCTYPGSEFASGFILGVGCFVDVDKCS